MTTSLAEDTRATQHLVVRSMLQMAAIIEAIELHKTYHIGKIEVPALRGISFQVEQGEFVTVVGPS